MDYQSAIFILCLLSNRETFLPISKAVGWYGISHLLEQAKATALEATIHRPQIISMIERATTWLEDLE
jgi:hypothetical protein